MLSVSSAFVWSPGDVNGVSSVFQPVGKNCWIMSEGAQTVASQRNPRARTVGGEVLFHRDIARLLQGLDMGAQIAFGSIGQSLQPHEFDLAARGQRFQRRHDLQPHRLMNEIVGLFHDQIVFNHKPPKTSAPPPTMAIHNRKWS